MSSLSPPRFVNANRAGIAAMKWQDCVPAVQYGRYPISGKDVELQGSRGAEKVPDTGDAAMGQFMIRRSLLRHRHPVHLRPDNLSVVRDDRRPSGLLGSRWRARIWSA